MICSGKESDQGLMYSIELKMTKYCKRSNKREDNN